MITIVNDQTDPRYPFSYFLNGSQLITKNGYKLKNKDVFWNDDPILVPLLALKGETINNLPGQMGFFTEEPIPDSLFTIWGFKYERDRLELRLATYSNDSNWGASIYNPKRILKRLTGILPSSFSVAVEEDYDSYNMTIVYKRWAKEFQTLGAFIEDGITTLKALEDSVGFDMAGFRWKPEYERDEALFSKEVVRGLLRKMKFQKIFYCHGKDEFGRDFIFSKTDKFGNQVNYGLQVKAGNINGRVNGQIDRLMGQIDDAFKMPFTRNNEPSAFISTLYIVISGKFTDNAKEKLRNKIPKGLYGSVHIIDKDRVIELMEKYC